jgi:hypothetical protein
MSSLLEVAAEHAAFRRRLALAVAGEAKSAWSAVDPARIRQSWVASIGRLLILLAGAQRAAAGQADRYLDDVLAAQRIDPAAAARVQLSALSGVASDGRSLETLLYRPVITALTGIQRGIGAPRALAGGQAHLDMIVRTQVADAGRAADLAAMTARRQVTGYVRMMVGGSCSRCAILAGRRYTWSAGFNRHPRCDCVHIPTREDSADDLRTDPRRYFDSLSAAEQDRTFTKAGAESIRSGADIGQVVNARRGMQTATVFGREARVTTVGAGRGVRLMPEQILLEASGNRDEAIRLLKLHRYLI